MQANLCSIMPAGALAARFATSWLEAQEGFARSWNELHHQGANTWRFAFRAIPAWEMAPWSLKSVPVNRDPDCCLCGSGRKWHSPERLDQLLKGPLP
jgi:hypothetical protein